MVVHRLCIVGLGLMGGAIGLAARRTNTAGRVIGVADSQDTIQRARLKGAVDEATLDLRTAVHDADLVILCVPVRTILDAAAAVIPACREGTIITDIGSSKGVIVHAVEALIHKSKSKVFFVGSHPVTGSEKKGIDASEQITIEGAPCVMTPTTHTDIDSSRKVDEFWRGLGMKTSRMSPEDHDAVLARSSHLPHLVSAALIAVQSDKSMDISGPGLRDTTRLAASDPAMWTDIAEQNAGELSKALKEMGQEMMRLSAEVEVLTARGTPGAEATRERLFRFLADARQRHEKRFLQPVQPAPVDPNRYDAEPGMQPPPL